MTRSALTNQDETVLATCYVKPPSEVNIGGARTALHCLALPCPAYCLSRNYQQEIYKK